jgi:hypothetical protein
MTSDRDKHGFRPATETACDATDLRLIEEEGTLDEEYCPTTPQVGPPALCGRSAPRLPTAGQDSSAAEFHRIVD